ncbi:WD repeat-containing protein jip5 [Pseudocyphellaria aurata]|nr:WD repeat-containing protein jip5 [Pseudocyphellaria aurata]
MFDNVCSLPLTSDLFAQSVHPISPFIALGLASGHVQIHRLPLCTNGNPRLGGGHGTIETAWRTHRHKGSCRSLSFSPDGLLLFSAGTDGLVKVAATETGQVISKVAIPQHVSSIDLASIVHALTPQSLLLATDSSAIHVYDLRQNGSFATAGPHQTHHPHDDYISSISPLPPGQNSTSGFSKQWISTGGTTIAVTDLRKGVLVQSEDLGEELLSGAIVGGKLAVGGEMGVLRIWEQGVWDRGQQRLVVGKGESVDVLSAVAEGVGGTGDKVAVGMGDGKIKIVDVRKRNVEVELTHDEVDGLIGLGFETEGRMISGGGQTIKVWQESLVEESEEEEEEEGVGEELDTGLQTRNGDRGHSEADQDESSDEVTNATKKRKRHTRNKGTSKGDGKHGVAFKGMD